MWCQIPQLKKCLVSESMKIRHCNNVSVNRISKNNNHDNDFLSSTRYLKLENSIFKSLMEM